MTYVIGISALYHDSAAAIIKDGKILFAAQEERFTRKKHDPSFPINSIKFVLNQSNISLSEVENIVFYDKPLLKFERILESYLYCIPKGFKSFRLSMPIWLKEKIFLKTLITKELKKIDKNFNEKKLFFSNHHLSHAASAFYPSPFEKAVVLTLDGVGEWATTTVSIAENNLIKIKKQINFPHSLGLLYSAFTYYCGFKVNSGEYKLMGLAPYGKPIYKNKILDMLIDLKEDGSFRLNQKYFNYISGLTMTSRLFSDLFKHEVRKPEKDDLTEFHMDIAASIQSVTEEIVIRITRSIYQEFKIDNLCLAGGVALNCVANGKILKDGKFKRVWIQPASGDAGGALGAALAFWYSELNNKRLVINYNKDEMRGSYLGPSFTDIEIEKELNNNKIVYNKANNQDELIKQTALKLSKGDAVGWFQGQMEFGPRSLGNRSILADPRLSKMQKNLNLKVKFRESFRPFAPAILFEDVNDWFEINVESPYMLLVSQLKKKFHIKMSREEESLFGINKLNVKRSSVPAITHVDYSARVQTVHKDTNLLFHKLISEFKSLTNCPILVNTSFNVRGEPIVCSPKDAIKCFMGTGLDVLILGNFIAIKNQQNNYLFENYKNKYSLD